MPVSVFENSNQEVLTFTLEPNGEQYELPHLARIGVRYSLNDGAPDRTFADMGKHSIRFWCDAPSREVEIIYPTPFDLLLADMCVRLGFCGGLVNGKPMHVTDLLPSTGAVTAEKFAELAISAESDVKSPPDKHLRWVSVLSEAFVRHMGADAVPAEALVQNFARPFDRQPDE